MEDEATNNQSERKRRGMKKLDKHYLGPAIDWFRKQQSED